MATIKGTINNDLLLSGKEFDGLEDVILGLAGNDEIDAGLGVGGNTLGGGIGDDLLWAGSGDLVLGDTGNDELDASDEGGNNSLYGGEGQDTIHAGENDRAFGGVGDDNLYAGIGNNTLYGGTGRDRFWIADAEVPTSLNTVADFDRQTDQIGVLLTGVESLADLSFEQIEADTVIRVTATGDRLALVKNTNISDFNDTNIIFQDNAPLNTGNAISQKTEPKVISQVESLGMISFPTSMTFEGTQVGGLSGIVYDPIQNLYYSISDDRSNINPARFYTLDINLSDGQLDEGDITFTKVTTLLDENGDPFAENSLDPEGIALTENGSVYISSEGEARPDIPRLTNPFVNQFSFSGQQLSELPVDEKYFPTQDGTTGIRNNLAFESLTITPDGHYLYTATENALVQDGPASSIDQASPSRIIKYDRLTGTAIAEYLYQVEQVPDAPIPEGSFATNGLVELLAIDDNGTLLALERAFSNGVGNTVKLYEIQTQDAMDVSGLDTLYDSSGNPLFEANAPVSKRLLVDFEADLGIVPDNLEGIALGPILADGRQSVIVVSDNNFSDTQTTQFIALALDFAPTPETAIKLTAIGTYATGQYGQSAAEIPAYDPATQRTFVVNAQSGKIDVLDASDPTNPTLITSIDTSTYGFPNSVAIKDGLVAIALENSDKQANGQVLFYQTNSNDFSTPLKALEVGALPDMLTFSPDGMTVLVANEGEPNDAYTIDPVGSISIIDLSQGLEAATVKTADFTAFNDQVEQLRAAGVKLKEDVGTDRTVAQDLEPEYIAVSPDGTKAWVTIQEANAIAVVDIATATVESIKPLGFKDYSQNNVLDASDRDNGINIKSWPIFGMYQPDAIASYQINGQTYYITANEGDSRDYGGYSEEARIKDLTLDPIAFPDAEELQKDENIGRLLVTTALGDTDGDGDYDQLYSYGGRSFSIWNDQGQLVYDSGDDLERITAERYPDYFNASNSNNNFDNRSDDKGPEPEGVTTGEINGRTYAFVGLERIGGVMIYDVTDPSKASFVQYVNNRDFSAATDSAEAKDLGPEGLVFVSAEDSPNGKPLLIVANEVSGTTTFYEIDVNTLPVNNPPTAVILSNKVTELVENSDTTGGIKVATISITDDDQGTNVLSLSGADAASFEIRNDELFFIGNSPNFETKNQYDVTVDVDDLSVGETPDASTDFTLNITNISDQDISDRVSQFTDRGDNRGSLVYNLNDVSGNANTQADDTALEQTDALFHNLVGLYQVENANGAILDTLDLNGNGAIDDLLNTGDTGYARTAITNAVNNFVLQLGANGDPSQNTSSSEFGDVLLQGGKLYSPFAIANGGDLIPTGGTQQDGINAFLAQNSNNTAANLSDFMTHAVAYFSFGNANPDGSEHLQNRGNNVFGFEDLPGNLGISDFDFNDAVFKFTFTA